MDITIYNFVGVKVDIYVSYQDDSMDSAEQMSTQPVSVVDGITYEIDSFKGSINSRVVSVIVKDSADGSTLFNGTPPIISQDMNNTDSTSNLVILFQCPQYQTNSPLVFTSDNIPDEAFFADDTEVQYSLQCITQPGAIFVGMQVCPSDMDYSPIECDWPYNLTASKYTSSDDTTNTSATSSTSSNNYLIIIILVIIMFIFIVILIAGFYLYKKYKN